MKSITLLSVTLWLAMGLAPIAAASPEPPLVLERTIPLNNVGGRIDHLAVDLKRRRVFIAELGQGAVEVIDFDKGASLGRISGLKEPQGLVYLPASDELVVASGGDGTVRFYRAADLRPIAVLPLGEDADNARTDDAGRVIVGYGAGALAVIDPATRRTLSTIGLPAHPESFRLAGRKAFINVPDARTIVVADVVSGKVVANWPGAHFFNFPMALSADGKRLAVVYRLPARLQIIDPASGATQLDHATCGDADDVFFDDARRRLYVVCGAGSVEVVNLEGPNVSMTIKTRSGARTGLYVERWARLLVAARAADGGAALLVYKPQANMVAK